MVVKQKQKHNKTNNAAAKPTNLNFDKESWIIFAFFIVRIKKQNVF